MIFRLTWVQEPGVAWLIHGMTKLERCDVIDLPAETSQCGLIHPFWKPLIKLICLADVEDQCGLVYPLRKPAARNDVMMLVRIRVVDAS